MPKQPCKPNKQKEALLTQLQLKEILHYNPLSGYFIWITRPSKCIHIGDIAGFFSHGYVQLSINKINYQAHRVVWLYMTGSWPVHEIDHINQIRNDNRFKNLRDTPNNRFNIGEYKCNKSGYKGVYLTKSNKYISIIRFNGKNIHLGTFDTAIEAYAEYLKAKKIYHVIS